MCHNPRFSRHITLRNIISFLDDLSYRTVLVPIPYSKRIRTFSNLLEKSADTVTFPTKPNAPTASFVTTNTVVEVIEDTISLCVFHTIRNHNNIFHTKVVSEVKVLPNTLHSSRYYEVFHFHVFY
jgi:hypothetical protein